MKNLFSIKQIDGGHTELDATPYLAATASPEVKAKMQSAFSIAEAAATPKELTEEEKQLRAKGNRYWAVCLACLAATLVMFFLGGDLGIYTAVPSLYVVNLALLAASIFFNIKAKRINRSQTMRFNENLKIDFSESTARLTEAAAEAARELGVPEDALTTDVLPYHYKEKNGKAVSTNKKGAFSNLAVTVFIKDEKLCFATAQELLSIPLSDIKGYREYNEDFELDMWLKPEEPSSGKYKAFDIRKSGFFSHKGHGYFGLLIGEDAYEVLIPCYDFEAVKALLEGNGVV
ncbi:MAG: hypothetical protein IKM33_04160 [Clostridia bacterium]|nr:hypothetical protein [Clostridia bacterium]